MEIKSERAMKYYFTLISNDHRLEKNKLEEAAKEATREASQRLISESELMLFKHSFLNKIKDLNTKFPRCRPLHAYEFNYYYNESGSAIIVGDVCNLDFYVVKDEI